jgi:hypothetical protein
VISVESMQGDAVVDRLFDQLGGNSGAICQKRRNRGARASRAHANKRRRRCRARCVPASGDR